MFTSVIASASLKQIVDFPTRGNNLLDLLFINKRITSYKVYNMPNVADSDHSGLLFKWCMHSKDDVNFNFDVHKENMRRPYLSCKWQVNKINWTYLQSHLMDAIFSIKYSNNLDQRNTDVNKLNQDIADAIYSSLDQTTPKNQSYNKQMISKCSCNKPVWVTPDCLLAIHIKRKLYARYKSDKSSQNCIIFKVASNKCKGII